MIEITHKQAQRMIRAGLDRAAPEEQWSALQVHLERCAECSAYRARRLELEKGLRRALRSRWFGMEEPLAPPALARTYSAHRQARSRTLRGLSYAGLALLVFALLGGYAAYRRANPPDPAEQQAFAPATETPVPTAAATPTPSLAESGYQGVVAFEALAEEGDPQNREIFLLAAGPSGAELTNLTAHPAEDSGPVWSPDGQWIAFLSGRDRPAGQADIYVISVAGTRLTRLTADPNLTWRGPLAWSPDGSWIAAAAEPAETGQSAGGNGFLYRVRLDGQPPRPLPGSRGGRDPRFAPRDPRLAYLLEEGLLAYMRVYDPATNNTISVNRGEAEAGSRAGPGALTIKAFEWSPQGDSILYITNRAEPERDPFSVEVRLARLRPPAADARLWSAEQSSTSRVLMNVPSFSPVLSAALTPQGDLVYTRTYRRDGQWVSCTPLLAASEDTSIPSGPLGGGGGSVPRTGPAGMLALPVLCVQSGLERAAWSADGQTLVAAAHSTTEDDPGIYAFLFPGGGTGRVPTRVVRAVRLLDLPDGAASLRPRPGISAAGRIEAIDPQPARPPAGESAPPARPSAELLRRALLVVKQDESFGIARLSADGRRAPVMENAWGAFCMRVSPDGDQVAFAATGEEAGPGGSEIYLMSADGRQRDNLTRLGDLFDLFNPSMQRRLTGQYGCPAWSPDGEQLAAWVTVGGQPYLVLTPTGGAQPSQAARYFELTPAGYHTPPIWLPGGRHLLLFLQSGKDRLFELASLDVRTGKTTRLAISDGWNSVSDAALALDGSLLAYAAEQFESGETGYAKLYLTGAGGDPLMPPITLLRRNDRVLWPGYDTLDWLAPTAGLPGSGDGRADQRLGMVRYGSGGGQPDAVLPSALLLYDPVTARMDTLIELEEELTAAAWSPDGEWALYSTPSGLWALSIRGALEGYAAPVWISMLQAFEIEWE